MEQHFTTDEALEVDVKLGMGRIDAERAQPGSAWASVEPVDPSHEPSVRLAAQASITLDDHRLRVHLPDSGRLFRRAEVAVRLGLPQQSSLAVRAGAVDISVVGGVDELSAKLGAGDVTVDEVAGTVSVKAGQTDVNVGTAEEVAVTTGQGSLTAGVVRHASFKTGQGAVRLGRTHGSVAVKGGSVDLDITEAAGGDVVFTTGSGSATVAVAPGTTVQLDLVSASGDVRCDLPMESAAPPGGAALHLRLRTGSGNLRVAPATANV
jgi:DUF4097 and DUF4098 domain-containing protein YvlB